MVSLGANQERYPFVYADHATEADSHPGKLAALNWTASGIAAATTATSPLNLPKAAQTGGYLTISQGGWWLSSREGEQRKMERHRGIEPLSSAWKAEVLPLDE